jgi:hypothetical protein
MSQRVSQRWQFVDILEDSLTNVMYRKDGERAEKMVQHLPTDVSRSCCILILNEALR